MSDSKHNELASWALESPPTGLHFSPDSQILYAYDGKQIYSWKAPGFEEHRRFSVPESEASREGICRFLGGGESIMLIASDDDSEEGIHHIAVRELTTHALKSEADIHVGAYAIFSLLLNRAEDRLLFRDYESMWHFFKFPSCQPLRSIQIRGPIRGTIYSPDESELWTVGSGSDEEGYRDYINAWDPQTGNLLRRRPPEEKQFQNGLRLTPDGELLLVVEETVLRVRSAQSWDVLESIEIPSEYEMNGIVFAFSPDARILALSSDCTGVFIIDCEKWRLVDTLETIRSCRCLAYSPDGKYLAAAGRDIAKEVKIWDMAASG